MWVHVKNDKKIKESGIREIMVKSEKRQLRENSRGMKIFLPSTFLRCLMLQIFQEETLDCTLRQATTWICNQGWRNTQSEGVDGATPLIAFWIFVCKGCQVCRLWVPILSFYRKFENQLNWLNGCWTGVYVGERGVVVMVVVVLKNHHIQNTKINLWPNLVRLTSNVSLKRYQPPMFRNSYNFILTFLLNSSLNLRQTYLINSNLGFSTKFSCSFRAFGTPTASILRPFHLRQTH